jgi:type IV secretory pathway VirB10-like protein
LSDFNVRLYHWEALVMASNAGIFFAGVGTTFIILGAGFSGGVMLASSAFDKPAEYQSRASAEPQSPVRVVLPAPAVAAQPPEQPQQIAAAPQPPIQPVQETQPLGEKQASKTGAKKAQAERRKRYAERKARRQAEKAKRQQSEPSDYQEAPVMAFGGDDRREFG